jgi:hypothetical protein
MPIPPRPKLAWFASSAFIMAVLGGTVVAIPTGEAVCGTILTATACASASAPGNCGFDNAGTVYNCDYSASGSHSGQGDVAGKLQMTMAGPNGFDPAKIAGSDLCTGTGGCTTSVPHRMPPGCIFAEATTTDLVTTVTGSGAARALDGPACYDTSEMFCISILACGLRWP